MADALTNETLVVGNISFRERSGSIFPYTFKKTMAELGVTLNGNGAVLEPTEAEVLAARAQDVENKPRDYANSAEGRLRAEIFARNIRAHQEPVTRLRQNLQAFFLGGGVPDHPIDNANYVWEGGENSMNVSIETDDETGTVTGRPGVQYIQVSGTAVWGFAGGL
jgi:hypothetical protein